MPLTFEALRWANLSRCSRWFPEQGVNSWSYSDWGVALAGEVGEALNIVKKMNRIRDGRVGNGHNDIGQHHAELSAELADIMIYLDLLAARANIDLAAATALKFNKTSERFGFPERLEAAP